MEGCGSYAHSAPARHMVVTASHHSCFGAARSMRAPILRFAPAAPGQPTYGNQHAEPVATQALMTGRSQGRNNRIHRLPGILGVVAGVELLASVLAVHYAA
jgi:hypothetical protein